MMPVVEPLLDALPECGGVKAGIIQQSGHLHGGITTEGAITVQCIGLFHARRKSLQAARAQLHMAVLLRSLYFKCAPHPGQGCDAGLPLRDMRGKDFSLAQHFDQLRDPAGSIHALR